MGPKAAAVAEAPALRAGANLFYVRIVLSAADAPEQDVLTFKANMNCRCDIALATAKRALLKDVEARIQQTNHAIANPEPPKVVEAKEGEEAPEPSIQAVQQALLQRLMAIGDALTAIPPNLENLELQDESGASIGLAALLAQRGTEVLKPAHKYTLGTLSGEEGAFVAL